MRRRLSHLALAVLLAWTGASLGPAAEGATSAPPGSPERRLLDLINEERVRRGLRRLAWDEDLARIARRHAEDMRAAGRVSHTSSDGSSYEDRLVRAGYRARAAAENVALDQDVKRAHEGLMNSPGHRRNILDRGLTVVGIGVVKDDSGGSLYVVENFSHPMAFLSDEEAVRRVRIAAGEERRSAKLRPLEEQRSLSRSLQSTLQQLVKEDTVKIDSRALPGPGWVVAYTSADPSELPEEARRRLRKNGSSQYGVAAAFARTRSQPFGAYWIVLGILEDQ